MPNNAQDALMAARQRHSDAAQAVLDTRTRLVDLEEKTRRGEPVGPAELSAAEAAVRHAELVATGTEPALREAEAAAALERADEVCDEVVATLRSLGSDVVRSLEGLEGPLADFVAASLRYDDAVRDASNVLGSLATSSPRWKAGPYVRNSVDDIFVESCRPMAQLARLLQPVVQEIAPSFVREQFKELAAGAPALPTSR